MKRIILLIILLVSHCFSDEFLKVDLERAVQINHELIKVMFNENSKIKDELKRLEGIIKDKESTQKMKSHSLETEHSNVYYVTEEAVFIRENPNSKANAVGKLLVGSKIECLSNDAKGWCKKAEKEFVWKGGLVKSSKKTLQLVKDTPLRTKPVISIDTYAGTIEKGSIIESLGLVQKKWYLLNNGLFITSDSAFSY